MRGPASVAGGARCAGGAVSDAARDDSRAWDVATAGVLAFFCLRGGSVARIAGCAAAGGGRVGSGAICDFGSDCGWVRRFPLFAKGAKGGAASMRVLPGVGQPQPSSFDRRGGGGGPPRPIIFCFGRDGG